MSEPFKIQRNRNLSVNCFGWIAVFVLGLASVGCVRHSDSLSSNTDSALATNFSFFTNSATIEVFYYKGSASVVRIPNSITGLPISCLREHCFNTMASAAKDIFVPHTVTNIEKDSLVYIPSLVGIIVDNGSQNYTSIDGVLFNKSTDTLIRYPNGRAKDFVLPKTVANIDPGAFGPNSWNIPWLLTNILVEDGNLKYSSVGGVLFDKEQKTLVRYPGGKSWNSYTVPNGVTTIGDEAFSLCGCLKEVKLPNSITRIGAMSFANCQNLTDVTIPESVTNVGKMAFINCPKLKVASGSPIKE